MNQSEQFILELIKREDLESKTLQQMKNEFSKTHGTSSFQNIDLVAAYTHLLKTGQIKEHPKVLKLIKKRSIRSLSGITSVTVTTMPYTCPGKCIYCPTEVGMPKSYLSVQPAMMRAKLNDFDPFEQTHNRLRALDVTGHQPEKIEIIIIGGTFSFLPKAYQTRFIKGIFNALNTYQQGKYTLKEETKGKYKYAQFQKGDHAKLGMAKTLSEAQHRNETAKQRCVGITIETRPDYITKAEIKRLRMLGVTRVEMGVQSIDEEVLEANKRGTTRKQIIDALTLLKDAGIKVSIHLMPGLYKSTKEKDIAMFEELFSNPDFQPDHLKVYPCMVLPFSYLERLWRKGEYTPYSEEDAIEVLAKGKSLIPPYVRVIRMVREIPKSSILAGITSSNLREMIEKKMKKEGTSCQCIRCREVKDSEIDPKETELITRTYQSSGGTEVFYSIELPKKNKLCAFLRLRLPDKTRAHRHYIPELRDAAIIREVHTYGTQLTVEKQAEEKGSQHQGFGKRMIKEAEAHAKSAGYTRIAVISGVGVRAYYAKQGYHLEGTYMVKELRNKKK